MCFNPGIPDRKVVAMPGKPGSRRPGDATRPTSCRDRASIWLSRHRWVGLLIERREGWARLSQSSVSRVSSLLRGQIFEKLGRNHECRQPSVISDGRLLIVAKRRRQPRLATIVCFRTGCDRSKRSSNQGRFRPIVLKVGAAWSRHVV